MRNTATVVLALAIGTMFATTAQAQVNVQYTVVVTGDIVKGAPGDHFLTLDEPMRLPDATLPAGTYIFTMLGSSAVRVSTADRSQQLATFVTIPVVRRDAAPRHEITLQRPAANSQRRMTQLFLPHQTVGLEFVYDSEEMRGEP
jgi:hypothetical protein